MVVTLLSPIPVYGTKDAPRGWFKNLHSTMLQEGFRPIPHEQAAYTLQEPDGSLAGIVIAHVDDLMWTGGSYVEEKMTKGLQSLQLWQVGAR